MRKYLIIFTILTGMIALTATECKKDEEADECSTTEMPTISRNFVIWAHITHQDNTPYTGEVSFNIRKTYCNGSVSGDYYVHHIESDDSGDWFSGMTYTYDFGNEKDKVSIYFNISNPHTHTLESFSEELYYADVVTWPDLLHIDITLPWDSQQ